MNESYKATANMEDLFLGIPSDDTTAPQGALESDEGADPYKYMSKFIQVTNMQEFIATVSNISAGLDIVQICGGNGLPGRIALRRRLRTGHNFDIVIGYDLNSKHDQRYVEEYIDTFKPLVVVMSPTCTPFGSWSNINKVINYDR